LKGDSKKLQIRSQHSINLKKGQGKSTAAKTRGSAVAEGPRVSDT